MSNGCEQLREQLSGYVDGALTPEERAAAEEHLDSCPDCRAELEALQRTVQAVASLPRRAAPTGLAGRVVAELRSENMAARPRVITVLWARALPIAAMLLIVFGITFMVGYQGVARRSAAPEKLAMSLARDEEAQEAEAPAEAVGRPAAAAEPMAAPAPAYEEKMDGVEAQPDAYAMRAVRRAGAATGGGGGPLPAVGNVAPAAAAAEGGRLRRPEDSSVLRDAVEAPAVAGEQAATAPGLYWHAVGEDRATIAAEGEGQTGFGAALATPRGGPAGGLPVRTVAFFAPDPEAAALEVVNVANASGLLVSVGLLPSERQRAAVTGRAALASRQALAGAAPAAEAPDVDLEALAPPVQETTVRLRVPAARCDALVAELRGALTKGMSVAKAAGTGGANAEAAAEAKESPTREAVRPEATAAAGAAGLPARVVRAAGRQDELRGVTESEAAGRTAMVELVVVIRPAKAEAVAGSAPAEQPAQ